MKIIFLLCLAGAVYGLPKRLGNPDEWGSYYQGDIRLPLPMPKNGLLDVSYRWSGGVVPYVFDENFEESKKPTVHKAMNSYDELTNGCIRFVQRTTEADYISFVDYDDGCYSFVGKQGGKQEINYPQWCIDQYGSVQHEMYHALGFFHEQSRTDRDDYVTIVWRNIQTGAEHNFDKYPDTYIGTFGENYDYGSVMHYSAYAFSKNGEKTIVTTDPDAQIGQRVGLSQVDIRKLMNMYNCTTTAT